VVLQGCGGGGGGGDDPVTVTTTTTMPFGPTGLPWCEDIATFYKISFDADTESKSAGGQCLPSTTPGAYYTESGQTDPVDGKSDRPWSCFSADFDPDLWTNEEARKRSPPFEGACLFKDFDSKVTPGKVDSCSTKLDHHPATCAPGPGAFWGACWSSHSENWKCIPQGDPTIAGLAKGDCKAQVLLEPASSTITPYFYNGVCSFDQVESKLYKCDTIPRYSASSASSCGQKVDTTDDKACFTLKNGAQWQCIPAGTDFSTPCDWTLLPDGSKDFYHSGCVFPSNKHYKDALDGHNLTSAVNVVV